MSPAPFVPLGDRVLVTPIQEDEVTAGGVIIPELARERPQRGTVIAVGPGARDDAGVQHPVAVDVGDVVVYSKYGGSELTLEGDDYVILREVDVLGKVA